MEREILKLEEQIVVAILSSEVEVLDQVLHDQISWYLSTAWG